ncbi:MAG: membrane protein insertion efficiency factor YidD [Anaerolineaceae bacterium]|nr:membrane protein insertion efficiency factor YidD [Anaerolineaceae bacterium]
MSVPGSIGRAIRATATALLIAPVRLYQLTLSPLLGRHCRFQPTCSDYFILVVRKHGPWRGAAKGIWRIMRCHPFGGSGYDPP